MSRHDLTIFLPQKNQEPTMAKKKPETPAAPAPAIPAPAMMPQTPMPAPAMPMQPGMPMQPAMMPMQPAMSGMQQANPMMAMMQMMQMMMGGGMAPSVVDPSAIPFTGAAPVADGDKGLDADIIRPA